MENIISDYSIGHSKVKIVQRNGVLFYEVSEPLLSSEEEEILKKILEELYYNTYDIGNLDETLASLLSKVNVDEEVKLKVLYHIQRRILYDKITPFLMDPEIEEVECRGPGYPITVVHRRVGNTKRLYTNVILKTNDEVIQIIEKLANRSDKPVSLAKPYTEFSLPEGHRVSATLNNEISLPGSTFDIRKFPISPLTITDVMESSMVSPEILAYLWFLLDHKPFIIFLGPTGSGKTTLMNATLSLLDPSSKIVSIEDTPELNLSNLNWVRFMTRESVDSNLTVTTFDLARLAMRYRPDYLVIGEVRGKEISTLIQASASGHGSMATFHGGRPRDLLVRIRGLIDSELTHLFLDNIWAIISISNVNGKRIVGSIHENYGAEKPKFLSVVKWSYAEDRYDISDVTDFVSRSHRINRIMKDKGLTRAEIEADLLARVKFLKDISSKKIKSSSKITKLLISFYKNGGGVEHQDLATV